MKRILLNLAVQDRGKKVIITELNIRLLKEFRAQRKIKMVLEDSQIDSYIHLDMTEIDIYDASQWKDADKKIRQAIEDKLEFRNKLA